MLGTDSLMPLKQLSRHRCWRMRGQTHTELVQRPHRLLFCFRERERPDMKAHTKEPAAGVNLYGESSVHLPYLS